MHETILVIGPVSQIKEYGADYYQVPDQDEDLLCTRAGNLVTRTTIANLDVEELPGLDRVTSPLEDQWPDYKAEGEWMEKFRALLRRFSPDTRVSVFDVHV